MNLAARSVRLDDTDLDLVAALQLAPRASHRVLAETLGTSVATASRRLARLRDQQLLRFTIQVPWWVRSETHPQHVWIATEAGTAPQVAATVARLPQAQYVVVTAGQSDVYAILDTARRDQMTELLTRTLPAIDGVVSTRAELGLQPYATAAGWRLHRLDAATEGRLATNGVAGMPSAEITPLRDEEREVIGQLQADGRRSAADIARHLQASPSTAHRIVQSLFERNIAVARVEVEPGLLGYPLEVVVALVAEPGRMSELATKLAHHRSTRYVATVAGHSSVMYNGVFPHETELSEFLSHDVAALPGISALEVSVVLQVVTRYWSRPDDMLQTPTPVAARRDADRS